MKIRQILERMSRGKVLKRSLVVHGQRWPIYVSPDSQLSFLRPGKKAFDADLIEIAENLINADSVVWDIGANVGVFTFAAASIVTQGTVVAVEPDIWLAGLLTKTRRSKAYDNRDIRIVPVAISDQDSIADFHISSRGRALNSLNGVVTRANQGGVREVQYVPTLSMDSLAKVMPAPDLIKADVEGAELLVIQGGIELLQNIRPVIYLEIGNDAETILSIFESNGYQMSSQYVNGRLNDIFFVPREKPELLEKIRNLRD